MATVEQLLVRIDASTEGLRRELQRGERVVSDTVSKMERDLKRNGVAFTTLQQNVERATRSIDQNGATTARRAADIAAYGQEMDRLRAKYSPLFAAQQQYRRQLDEVNRALAVGAINQAEYGTALAATKAGFAQQVAAIRGTANALNAGGGQYRQFGLIAQQAGFQVGDFAVQVASGQSAVVAFTQQFSQLAGFFGPVGAVLGAVAAIAGGLYLAFDRGRESTREATEATYSHVEALEAADRIMRQIEGLTESRTDAIRRERDETIKLAEAEIARTQAAVDGARQRMEAAFAADPETSFGVGNMELMRLRELQEELQQARDNVQQLRDRFAETEPALKTYEDAQRKVAKATEAAASHQERLQESYQGSLATLESESEVLAIRIRMFGEEEEAVWAALTTYELRNEAIEAGIGLSEEEEARIALVVGRLKEQREQLRLMADRQKATARATEEAARAQERQREEIEKLALEPFKNALESVQRTFADTFEDIFSGGIRTFGDLADSIKRIMIRLAAEVATLQFFGPQGLNIAGLLGGAGGVAGAAGSGGGFNLTSLLNNGSSLWSAFSGGTSAAFNGFALSGAGASLGLSQSAAMAGVLEGAGSGIFAATGAGGAAAGGTAGATLTSLGSTLAAAAPYALAAIAAITIATQLFKKKPSDFTASFQGMLGEDFIQSEDKANPETRQMRDQIQSATETALKAVLSGFGLDTPQGTYLDVAAGTRDQLRFWLYDTMESYAGQPASVRSDPIASGSFATVEELIGGVLEAVIARAGTEGLTEALRAVAEQADFSDLETALADIEFAKVYDGLGQTVKATAEADAAIAEINARFDELTEFAERFGLAVDKVDTGRADAFSDLATGFTAGLRDQILALTDPAQLAVRELEAWRDAQIRNAKAIAEANGMAGASTEDLALIMELYGLRMEQIAGDVGDALNYITAAQASVFNEQIRAVETYLAEVERNNETWRRLGLQLRQTRNSLLIDDALSPLSPELRRQEAARQFEDIARRAALGDQDAIAELPDISRAYLEASRAYYASSEAYFADFQRVQAVLQDTEALTGRHVSIGDQQLAAARDQVQKLTDLINGDRLIVSSIEQANTILADILAQLQAAGVPGAGGGGSGTGSMGTGISYVDTGYQRTQEDLIQGIPRTTRDAILASLGQTVAGGGVVQARIASDPAFADAYRDAIRAAGGSPGFATGGSFMVGGPAGNDNLVMPPVRVTAGEMVNISRRDSMEGVLAELRGLRADNRALRAEVADLRAVTAAGANAQVGATDRAARTFDNGFRDNRQRVRIGASAKDAA